MRALIKTLPCPWCGTSAALTRFESLADGYGAGRVRGPNLHFLCQYPAHTMTMSQKAKSWADDRLSDYEGRTDRRLSASGTRLERSSRPDLITRSTDRWICVAPGNAPFVDFDHDAARPQEHDGVVVQDAVLRVDRRVEAPAMARRFLAEHRDHVPAELLADAELVLTEVVTNAVLHGREEIVIRVRASPPGIGLAVSDQGPPIPQQTVGQPVAPDSDATGGRGLLIVDAIASAWGVNAHEQLPGKTVWIELQTGA